MFELLRSVLNESETFVRLERSPRMFDNHIVWDTRGRTVSKAEDGGEMLREEV